MFRVKKFSTLKTPLLANYYLVTMHQKFLRIVYVCLLSELQVAVTDMEEAAVAEVRTEEAAPMVPGAISRKCPTPYSSRDCPSTSLKMNCASISHQLA